MEFGGVLKKMRFRAHLSQEQMADRMFISRSNVSKLENNKLELKAKDLVRWCQETNGQDMLIAVTCGIDPSVAVDGITNLMDLFTNVAPGLINLIGVII